MIPHTFDYAVFCVARSGPQEDLKIWWGARINSTIFEGENFAVISAKKSGKGTGPENPPPTQPVPTVLDARYSCCSDIC